MTCRRHAAYHPLAGHESPKSVRIVYGSSDRNYPSRNPHRHTQATLANRAGKTLLDTATLTGQDIDRLLAFPAWPEPEPSLASAYPTGADPWPTQ